MLPLDRRSELLRAHSDFQLVVSYNPGYHGMNKSLKPSTRQRFTAIEFGYPTPDHEAAIVARESGLALDQARALVALAVRTRRLEAEGLDQGASTRMLVHAGALIGRGIAPRAACLQAIALPLSDDPDLSLALRAAVEAGFG
jgi:nitric oxide reductase NorQ protein